MATFKEQKELIRAEVRARRASIPGQLRLKAAESLASHVQTLLSRLSLKPCTTIGCYLAIGTEINTSPVVRALTKHNFQVALPRTSLPSAPMDFIRWQANEPLIQDILGFPTAAGDDLAEPDALFIPLVAFDRAGGRIGQGSGLYDRTLAALKRQKPFAPVIGLAFACQEVTDIPTEAHDQPLDYILTEMGIVEVAKELEPQALSL